MTQRNPKRPVTGSHSPRSAAAERPKARNTAATGKPAAKKPATAKAPVTKAPAAGAKATAAKKPAAKGPARRPAAKTAAKPAASLPDFDALVSLRHHDPHQVLGIHADGDGMLVRCFRPDAGQMNLLVEGRAPLAMDRVHDAGVFQARVPKRKTAFDYRLEVVRPGGHRFAIRDPYAQWPTVGEQDLYLWGEGRHERAYDKLGAHPMEHNGVPGTAFAVWAPNARGASVVGDFNDWDGRTHPMRSLGGSGIWELFVPDLEPGRTYKFELRGADGNLKLKADPFAQQTEVPPATASVTTRSTYRWQDADWMAKRREKSLLQRPMAVYELHLGSWRTQADGQPLSYRDAAPLLADYMEEMGFTHVELMPVTEHPFGGSWGYQVGAYFAPTSRFGTPDDLRFFIDTLHQRGIGVLLDWVPAHFPTDEHLLGRFDGTALYEHLDPRLGWHPDWNTYIFNYGRNEVCNFLLASALFWLEQFHFDGLRLDAVASMLYRDYSRKSGEWLPNEYGGRENLEAINLLKRLNEVLHAHYPGALMVAEESTSWGGVSRPTYVGGLGFTYKWNMGWMHDVLRYFSHDPIHRRFHHHDLTFGLLYAWTENFVLPLSHDEVVHGKRSLLDKMPGDRWQKFANLRALYGFMWAHPGKKLLFMGGEIGQWREWSHDHSLDWHLLEEADHAGLQGLVRDLNRVYRAEPALWELDHEGGGFEWIDSTNSDENVLAFLRKGADGESALICVCNLSPMLRENYRLALPRGGEYIEVLNTDAGVYGGSNAGNAGRITAEAQGWYGRSHSALVVLPPLGTVWFRAPKGG